MKQLYILLLIIPTLILSCDKIDDANTIDIDTTISMEVPVAVLETNAIALKSVTDYSFSESGTASLMDNTEIMDCLEKIESIEVNKLKVIFYGLESGMVIETISFSVSGIGEIASISNVTNTNASHTLSIDNSKLTKIASILESNWAVTATVSGTTNTAPMWFSINMEYDLHVEAKAL